MKDIYISAAKHCDVHPERDAEYDEPTIHGPWANLCAQCHTSIGANSPAGYHLVVGEAPVRARWETAQAIQDAARAGAFDLIEELVGDGDLAEFL